MFVIVRNSDTCFTVKLFCLMITALYLMFHNVSSFFTTLHYFTVLCGYTMGICGVLHVVKQ